MKRVRIDRSTSGVRNVRSRRWLVALLAVGFVPSIAAYPQEKPATEEPAKTESPSPEVGISLESVSSRLKAAEALEGQEELKAKLVPLLKQTETLLQQADALAKEAETYRFDPTKTETKPPETEPVTPDKTLETKIRESEDLPALRTELKLLTDSLDAKSSQLKAIDLWGQKKLERQAAFPKELSAVKQRLEELKQAPKPPEGEAPEVTQARRDLLRAETKYNEQLQDKLLLEQKYFNSDVVTQQKSQEKTSLQREIDRGNLLVDIYRKRIGQLEIKAATDLEDKIKLVLNNVSPKLRPLVEEIQQRSKERTGAKGLIQRRLKLEKMNKETEEKLLSLNAHRESTQSYLEYISNSESLTSLLDSQRALLPPIPLYEQRIIEHSRENAEVRSQLPELNREIEDLSKLESKVAEITEQLDPSGSEEFERETRAVLELKLQLLLELKSDLDENARLLSELTTTEAEMIRFSKDYREYLESKSMWVKVSPNYSFADFSRSWAATKRLCRPEPWQLFLEKFKNELFANPVASGAIVLAILIFLGIHTKLKKRVNEYHQQVSTEILAPFAFTRKAFGLTLILALWIPILVGIVGYQISLLKFDQAVSPSTIQQIDERGLDQDDEAFAAAIGTGLFAIAFLFGALRLTRVLCRPQGLGDVHFRWPRSRTLRVRRNLRWYVWSIIPITFFLVIVQSVGNSEERNSLGRGLLSIALLLTAFFLYRVLAPIRPTDARSSRVVLTFTEKLTIYVPVMVPILFALLTLFGYSETTPKLATRLIETSVVMLPLVMINEMSFRWLYIARGKIALEQARQRQEAREQAEAENAEPQPVVETKPTGLDLSAINVQTRNLLTTSFRLAVFVALWFLWNDVTPRVGILDYQLWETNHLIQAAQAASGEQSTEAASEVLAARWITLGDVLLFLIILGVTFVASRNLPGLLEVSVLQNLPIDTGVRYAVGMMAKYCLLAIGILIAMSVLNLGVTQLSFVLGGLAVGLGFGLQELFANFVSGIILLFEQPLRIGDIVSIGDVTGTVTRIRIRATTVTDWDRKEYIVPNKELITGTFRNWTLTDSVNRIVIVVGVAYGSNTDQARRILLQVCREHPKVLDDPEPVAVFDAFGDSALNLTLRCFLANFDNRLNVIHELHSAIDRRFKQAGLEIAFPQMDLHLRSIEKVIDPLPLTRPKLETPAEEN